MRYLQALLFLAFLFAIGVFAVQNRDTITVNFLTWKISQPVAILSIATYALGMLTGWTVVAFLRRSFRGATANPQR
jgi:uncharacterized integral membrane protein